MTPKFKVQNITAGKSQWQEIEATDQSHCTCVRSGWNKNDSHRGKYLNSWFRVDDAVWGGLEGATRKCTSLKVGLESLKSYATPRLLHLHLVEDVSSSFLSVLLVVLLHTEYS